MFPKDLEAVHFQFQSHSSLMESVTWSNIRLTMINLAAWRICSLRLNTHPNQHLGTEGLKRLQGVFRETSHSPRNRPSLQTSPSVKHGLPGKKYISMFSINYKNITGLTGLFFGNWPQVVCSNILFVTKLFHVFEFKMMQNAFSF